MGTGHVRRQAVAEILFGQVNPSGKLPITIPQTAGHIPQYYYQTKSRYTTGYGLGSSRKDDRPAFCFGHGLSYTSFQYDGVQLSDTLLQTGQPVTIRVEVTNTGKQAGYETVLVFVKDEVSECRHTSTTTQSFPKDIPESGRNQAG